MASNETNHLLRQLDRDTAALIQQLQQEESHESKFKTERSEDPDLQLARQLQEEELERIFGVLEDGRLARQIQGSRIDPNPFEHAHRRLGRYHHRISPVPTLVARPQEIVAQAATTPSPARGSSSRHAVAQADTFPTPTPVVRAQPLIAPVATPPVPAQGTDQAITPQVPAPEASIQAQPTADGAKDNLGATPGVIVKARDIGKSILGLAHQFKGAARGATDKLQSSPDGAKDLVHSTAASGITVQSGATINSVKGAAHGLTDKAGSIVGAKDTVSVATSGVTNKASGTLNGTNDTAGLGSGEGDIAQATTSSVPISQTMIESTPQPTSLIDPLPEIALQSTATNESSSQTVQPSEFSPTSKDEVTSLITSTNDNTAIEEHSIITSENRSSMPSTDNSTNSKTTTSQRETVSANSSKDFEHNNPAVLKNESDADNRSTSISISDDQGDEITVAEPDIQNDDSRSGESSTSASPPTNAASELTQEQIKKPKAKLYECAICVHDNFAEAEVILLPCKHLCCKKCVEEMFNQSLLLTGFFPPRCCTPITSIPGLEKFLKPGVKLRFEEKMIEIKTKNPLFCSVEACSAFILPEAILYDKATCLKCNEVTCTKCRKHLPNGFHDDILCDLDISTKELRAFMKLNKHQECPNCKNGVSMSGGCNHMHCVACGANWCYLCLKDYTKLRSTQHTCPQYSDENLNGETDKNPTSIPAPRPGQSYEEMLDEILKCTHKDIRKVKGEGKCDHCEHEMPNYHFKCANGCFQMCWKCLVVLHPFPPIGV